MRRLPCVCGCRKLGRRENIFREVYFECKNCKLHGNPGFTIPEAVAGWNSMITMIQELREDIKNKVGEESVGN